MQQWGRQAKQHKLLELLQLSWWKREDVYAGPLWWHGMVPYMPASQRKIPMPCHDLKNPFGWFKNCVWIMVALCHKGKKIQLHNLEPSREHGLLLNGYFFSTLDFPNCLSIQRLVTGIYESFNMAMSGAPSSCVHLQPFHLFQMTATCCVGLCLKHEVGRRTGWQLDYDEDWSC